MKRKKKGHKNVISQLEIYSSVRKGVQTRPSKSMDSKKKYNRKDKSWKEEG